MKNYIGIDNGITGSVFILEENNKLFFKTPIKIEQSYTKTKQNISRIDFNDFCNVLKCITYPKNTLAIIERPMVNPGRFKATASALRCLEATLIALENYGIAYKYIDSKEWQKELLPKDLKKEDLKKASQDIACRLFPEFKEQIIKQKDGDSILIAEYARKNNF